MKDNDLQSVQGGTLLRTSQAQASKKEEIKPMFMDNYFIKKLVVLVSTQNFKTRWTLLGNETIKSKGPCDFVSFLFIQTATRVNGFTRQQS